MRETDIFDLDFTTPAAAPADTSKQVKQAATEVGAVIHSLEQALESGPMEEAGWRMLASLYLGANRMSDFTTLEARHEEVFGTPIFANFRQESAPRDTQRIVFDMPKKIVQGSLPDIAAVLEACAAPEGALLEFSRVNGADIGGLKELTEYFSKLPRDDTKPEIPGMERFITSLEKAADSSVATEEMWQMLFEYRRFCNDADIFDELAIRYAEHFGISPPSW